MSYKFKVLEDDPNKPLSEHRIRLELSKEEALEDYSFNLIYPNTKKIRANKPGFFGRDENVEIYIK